MKSSNNDNVNVRENKLKNNDNVNDIDKAKAVEMIAHRLADMFHSPDSFPFYCKVAYSLPEHKIWSNYEQSQKGNSPARLFNWLCRRDMK